MTTATARLTPVDEEGIPCGDSILLTEGVDVSRVGKGNLSICWPTGVPVSERYHVMVEVWTPRASSDGTEPGPYAGVRADSLRYSVDEAPFFLDKETR